MSDHVLDYDLDDEVDGSSVERMKAMGDPVRSLVLDLVLERAMTVSELAARVGKAKGTMAHHVDVLVAAGLLQVVRTRKVRAVEERFYGRVARTIHLASGGPGDLPFVADATREADFVAMAADTPDSAFTLRHARIPADQAEAFVARVMDLAIEFTRLPRAGDVEYAFLAGVFPTIRPVAPTHQPEDHR